MNPIDETLLRTLDAAPASLTTTERDRAEALLERIVTTEAPAPNGAAASSPLRPRARSTRRLRLVLVPIAALALTGGLLLAQGSGPQASAYASWMPTPSAADPKSLALADAACRADLRSSGGDRTAGPSLNIDRASTGLADRRGDFVAIVYWTPDPDLEATCIVYNPPGSADVDVVSSSGGSSWPASTVAADDFILGGYFQSTGPEPTGLTRLLDPGPYFRGSVISGVVGSNVIGLTVHAGTFTTEASIADGRYGAWWPGPAAKCTSQKSGVLKCDPLMTYDLHLADGTTTTNAKPAQPT